ncbi:MAG: questin oxidase family protein [Rubrivivax sp.]|nr:questin oxidase family protein [Rubrivivax sp.]
MSTLAALLHEGAAYDAEYGNGLSNHLPMALFALRRLGAGEARLQAFARAYLPRLDAAPAAVAWPAGDAWPARLGERAAWPAYRDLFTQWLAHEGAPDLLAQVLPRLMQGVGAAAFHGLVRTASALQAEQGQELADALAYWACRWLDLGHSRARGRAADPARLLPRLPVAAGGARLIFERMSAAAALPAFVQTVAQLRVDESTLPRLAELAATLYARSGDFTVLHLVTSAHAMRVLLPFVEEPLPAVRAYWRAFAAGVASTDLEPDELAPPLPWERIVEFALASDDEHVIKLVDSCREETAAYGGDAWQRAASRLLRR